MPPTLLRLSDNKAEPGDAVPVSMYLLPSTSLAQGSGWLRYPGLESDGQAICGTPQGPLRAAASRP